MNNGTVQIPPEIMGDPIKMAAFFSKLAADCSKDTNIIHNNNNNTEESQSLTPRKNDMSGLGNAESSDSSTQAGISTT